MTDENIKAKQALFKNCVTLLKRKLLGLKRIVFCTPKKKSRLDSLTELCSANGGEISSEEQKLSKHVVLYEARRSGLWNLAKEIDQQKHNLKKLKPKVKRDYLGASVCLE